MDALSSAEFRKRYAELTEPTTITANGRPFAVFYPLGTEPAVDVATALRGIDFCPSCAQRVRQANKVR